MSVTFSYAWPGAAALSFGWNPAGASQPAGGTETAAPIRAAVRRLPWLQILAISIALLALIATVSNILFGQQARLAEERRALRIERAAYLADLRLTQLACAQIAVSLRNQGTLNPSADPAATASDLEAIVGLCDNVRRQLQQAALRGGPRMALGQTGQARRATGQTAPGPVAVASINAADSSDHLGSVGDLVNIAAYGGGAVLTGTGLLNFRKHVDDPSRNELRKSLGPDVVGIGLLAFPTMAGYLDEAIEDSNPLHPRFQ
jgi:hypothetical protein